MKSKIFRLGSYLDKSTLGGMLLGFLASILVYWQGFLSHLNETDRLQFLIFLFTTTGIVVTWTWLPCQLDRWLHGVKFNLHHPLTHHPGLFLMVLGWHRVMISSPHQHALSNGMTLASFLDMALLGWFIHLTMDLLFREGLPLGFKPLRRKKEFFLGESISERTTRVYRWSAFTIPPTWNRFRQDPLGTLLTLGAYGLVMIILIEVAWDLPF